MGPDALGAIVGVPLASWPCASPPPMGKGSLSGQGQLAIAENLIRVAI